MRKTSTGKLSAVALAAAALIGTSGAAAQNDVSPAPVDPITTTITTADYTLATSEVQGRVLAMSTTDQRIVLDDGSVLRLTAPAAVAPRDLDDRAMVRVRYEARDGEKLVTWILVEDHEVQAP